MFQKIRRRLLLNNVLVFAFVLAGSAVAVRLVFVRSLQHQLAEQLTALGQSVVSEAELQGGRLKVEDDFLAQTLVDRHQSFEWFDSQGKSVEKLGTAFPSTPLNTEATVEVLDENPSIQSITLPILEENSKALIGYVRVSQLLDEFDETVLQLDIGLGVGTAIAIVLSSGGILWLNRQAMQPIEASFQRLKQFTADASHELRSPLMAISSNVEVALKYSEGMRAEDCEAMTAMLSATEQMTRLTEDLLLLARTEKVLKIQRVSLNLSELLEDLGQLYYPQIKEKQIALTVDLQPNLRLQGDRTSLTRAFTNLLQNAIRYTPAGGKIELVARKLGTQLRVTVADTGVGIAKEHLEKVFERFWRADRARNYDDSGAGLGLSITQAIIRGHDGSLEVDSVLNSGSCFTVSLPIGNAD